VGTWHDPDLGRPIAAPLERCAELLGVDLATICAAAANVEPYLRADGTRVWSLMQLERQLRPQAYGRRRGGYLDRRRSSAAILMGDLPAALPKGALMPATTPEQIHRLFEDRFNDGDLDGLMELYEPDAALIAQPGSVANGVEQARAALQGFLSLNGRITLDTKLVVTVGELAYLANTWSLRGTGPDGNPVALGATTAEVARRQADGSWRYVIDNAWGDQAVAD
jgi:uncharacterized protein (TIGR02246 family)